METLYYCSYLYYHQVMEPVGIKCFAKAYLGFPLVEAQYFHMRPQGIRTNVRWYIRGE